MRQLAIQQVSKAFQSKIVLNQVSLSVDLGKILVLLGGSGSGKSTLLRCMNLLETPDTGTLQVDEWQLHFPIDKSRLANYPKVLSQIRKRVGMVFQQFNLWPHLTVMRNVIEAPLRVLKKDPASLMNTAEQLLARLGIADKKNSYPAGLSGGQQQRVAIARTLMMEPEFILWDEPNSGLDPEKSRDIAQIIRDLAKKDITHVIATHDIPFALEVADDLVFLEKGQVVEKAPVQDKQVFPREARFQAFLSLDNPSTSVSKE